MAVSAGSGTDRGRKLPRVTVPLTVGIGGAPYRAMNWSVDGFCIDAPPNVSMGDTVDSRLCLQFDGVAVTFPAAAKMVSLRDRRANFQFTRLEPEQAGVLHRVIEDHLNQQVVQVDEFLEAARISPPEPSRAHKVDRLLRLGFMTALLGAVMTGIVMALSAMLFTQQSQIVAVTSPGWVIKAMATGVSIGPPLAPGTLVEPGTLLAKVTTPELAEREATLSAGLVNARLDIDNQRTRLSQMQGATEAFKTMIETRLAALKTKADSLNKQINLYRDLNQRREAIVGRVMSQNWLDAQRILEGSDQAQLQGAQAEVSLAKLQESLAAIGMFSLTETGSFENEQTIAIKIAQAENSLNGLQTQLNVLEGATALRSPCHCKLGLVNAPPGATVTTGTPLFTLLESGKQSTVQALIPIDKVAGLSIGSPAAVVLNSDTVKGRLERISFDPDPHQIGLPEEVINADRKYAIATIALPEGIGPVLVGTPAKVFLGVSPFSNLKARVMMIVPRIR
ncbi:MAG: HlyD family efflux transporter periplasmic adaptor subunit [Xanthobacteraceae bacterium]|nr:HlyD family efflux transporter periplasmic adaptor subunit [Xanthobacteraceae bacterium]